MMCIQVTRCHGDVYTWYSVQCTVYTSHVVMMMCIQVTRHGDVYTSLTLSWRCVNVVLCTLYSVHVTRCHDDVYTLYMSHVVMVMCIQIHMLSW